jgi:Tol biopolymer transport system component
MQEGGIVMVHNHLPVRDQPRDTWVGLLAVLILAAVPLLAASTFSAPAAQTVHPVSYLPLVKWPYYRIAFVSWEDQDIYVMNADGSGQTNLTKNLYGSALLPAWSPSGRQIAFVFEDLSAWPNLPRDIYVMNADGSGQTNLTRYREGMNPAWSPSGRQIAFLSTRDGNQEIYVMNTDGSNQIRLTTNSASDYLPLWSPDERKIAFQSNRDLDAYADIYVMNADGSNQIRLTNPGYYYKESPTWSPTMN